MYVHQAAVLGAAEVPLNHGPQLVLCLPFLRAAGQQPHYPHQPALGLLVVLGVAIPREVDLAFEVASLRRALEQVALLRVGFDVLHRLAADARRPAVCLVDAVVQPFPGLLVLFGQRLRAIEHDMVGSTRNVPSTVSPRKTHRFLNNDAYKMT